MFAFPRTVATCSPFSKKTGQNYIRKQTEKLPQRELQRSVLESSGMPVLPMSGSQSAVDDSEGSWEMDLIGGKLELRLQVQELQNVDETQCSVVEPSRMPLPPMSGSQSAVDDSFKGSWEMFSSPITLLIIISCSLLILTAASFLYLIPKLFIFLAALFLLSLIIGLIYCCSIQTEDDHGATGYESYKPELKQFRSLSSTVTSLAFCGLVATLVGYSKKSSEQALTQIMEVSILLMFFVAMMGLFLMLWSSAPPRMENQTARVFFPKVLKNLSYSLLGLLAVTATVVSSAYLESYLPLALSPVLVLGVIVWFVMKPHCQGGRRPDHKAELKPMSKVATVTTQITFGGMMSVFSGLFGNKDSGFQHKIFMLLMFFAFLSSFSVKLLTVSTLKAATQITVIRILNTCTFLFLALGAAAVYLVVVMGG
ncbi:hypothetical protein C4D60_Mb05t28370 [Musa balbisiana]|uniref:Transmembrane protein n=1 Tax=Musa balbisiana TaxID=52838 RepID=A0A4S8JZG3_MUSBA|nr:hypothetical protein C4D60_Mb05t28370 [Musa balbisiana]